MKYQNKNDTILSAVLVTLILLLISVSDIYPEVDNTTPPPLTWISPEEFSVNTTNTIRLAVDVSNDVRKNDIEKIIFSAKYFNYIEFNDEQKIGEVTKPPYEIIWDCSQIPDQNFGKLSLMCEVHYKKITTAGEEMILSYGMNVVLDRNPLINTKQVLSDYMDQPVIIDGNLDEWPPAETIVFTNADNKITVNSLWDEKNLYFGVRVNDKNIISTFGPGSSAVTGMPVEDDIEIYLDVDHNHSEIIIYPDRHFLFAPAGMVYEVKYYPYDSITITENHPRTVTGVHIEGTMNDNSDEDRYYSFEIAIPWSELGIEPHKNVTMGLEIWNSDKEYPDGNYIYSGWNTSASNCKNTSEWGNIILVRKNMHSKKNVLMYVITGCIVFITGFIFLRKYAGKKHDSCAIENEFIIKAKTYIEEHYGEEELSRDQVAHFIGLTPSYFGKLFTRETGCHFREYVNKLRVDKSKLLLSSTTKNIAEIAFDVGFSSQSHYTHVFNHFENTSPRQYRSMTQIHK